MVRKKFCYKCGSPDVYKNGLCRDCYLKSLEKPEKPLKKIVMCKRCGRVYSPRKRKFVDKSISSLLSEYYGVPVEASVSGKQISAIIHGEKDWEEEFRLSFTTCKQCSRLSGGYHEARVQLRDGLDFLENLAIEYFGSDISRIEKLKKGTDILFMDKASAKAFISVLKHKYEIKFSRKLVGEKAGKKLYRDTYAVRKWMKK